jgi:hypothetical protein
MFSQQGTSSKAVAKKSKKSNKGTKHTSSSYQLKDLKYEMREFDLSVFTLLSHIQVVGVISQTPDSQKLLVHTDTTGYS